MTPEAKTKAQIKRVLNDTHTYFFMPTGGGYGRAGIPDFIACKNGHFIGIEAKAGKGVTTALQDLELSKIKAAGGHAIVVNEHNMEQLREMLDDI